jgi:hypothetical protein
MKKLTTIFGAFLIASAVLTSCSGGGDAAADGQRYCDLLCESHDLMNKAMSGDQSVLSEATALSQKAMKLSTELTSKYQDDADAWAIIGSKMQNCGCY